MERSEPLRVSLLKFCFKLLKENLSRIVEIVVEYVGVRSESALDEVETVLQEHVLVIWLFGKNGVEMLDNLGRS